MEEISSYLEQGDLTCDKLKRHPAFFHHDLILEEDQRL